MESYDFSGWATRNDLKCSDGRIIMKDAFKHNDGDKVPLVWNHQHNDPLHVLGHAILENREDGVYSYCKFNDTEAGRTGKLLVEHGDVESLSIYANQLKQQGPFVQHGKIREVSLVLAGANPGAYIDSIIQHSDGTDEEAIIYNDETISIAHAEEQKDDSKEEAKVADKEKTVGDVLETFNEEQKQVLEALIGMALEQQNDPDEEDEEDMKHNVFDNEEELEDGVIAHSDMMAVINDAKRYGSMRDSALAHSITDIAYLFPEAKNLNNPPEFITRKLEWVDNVMNGVHHTPFSRIKSMFADLTEADARAKGYIKGKLKKEEVFGLLKRTTTPTTIYKKQKMDRDDVIDITDFDVVAWLKTEMRLMLDEEIARAILVGDGRLASSDDKINEQNIRPIWTDADLYTVKNLVASNTPKAFIQSVVRARKDYRGSGNPTLYCTEDILTECLLMEDTTGRVIYDTVDKLATAMRVKSIVTVPVMEGLERTDSTNGAVELMGILVNLNDYNVGADKGGAINMFDDFDIDYNAQKYLIETRCSGALTKPYSAVAFEVKKTTSSGT